MTAATTAWAVLLALKAGAASPDVTDDFDAGVGDPIGQSQPLPSDAETLPAVEGPSDAGETAPSPGPSSEPAPAEPSSAESGVEVTGYGASRTSWTRAKTWGLLPTDDIPQFQEALEFNTQLKVKLRSRSALVSDVSLVGQWGGHYRGVVNGRDQQLPDHASDAVKPAVSINELYLLHEVVPEFNVVVGKKRIVWGSGMGFNPTDLLNARRDPTDPTYQRAGAWLAQVEVPLETVTLSVVFAPALLRHVSGIPTHFLTWPDFDAQDREAHYQLAARAYALVGNADVNVMLFYGNKYNDDFGKKVRVGLSFSRTFLADDELHAEVLLQSGSARARLNPTCVQSLMQAAECYVVHRSLDTKQDLDSAVIFPRLLVGSRRQFGDDTVVSLEYLYQADGWSKDDFESFGAALELLAQARASSFPVDRLPPVAALQGGTNSDGLPARVSFEPRAQHSLFATIQRPRLFDDFTLQLVVVANLQDLSTLWAPSVTWSARQWLSLTLFGFIAAPGPDGLAPQTPSGVSVSEFGSVPFAGRVMLEARAWF